MPTGESQLSDDTVEAGCATLGAPDVVVRTCRVPERQQRPPLRAVMEQAPERYTHFDRIDLLVTRTRHGRAKNANGQIDQDTLVAR